MSSGGVPADMTISTGLSPSSSASGRLSSIARHTAHRVEHRGVVVATPLPPVRRREPLRRSRPPTPRRQPGSSRSARSRETAATPSAGVSSTVIPSRFWKSIALIVQFSCRHSTAFGGPVVRRCTCGDRPSPRRPGASRRRSTGRPPTQGSDSWPSACSVVRIRSTADPAAASVAVSRSSGVVTSTVGSGEFQRVTQFGRLILGVRRRHHAVDVGVREQEEDEFGSVRQEHAHSVTGLGAEVRQRVRVPFGLVSHFAKRVRLVGNGQKRFVRRPFDPHLEQIFDTLHIPRD